MAQQAAAVQPRQLRFAVQGKGGLGLVQGAFGLGEEGPGLTGGSALQPQGDRRAHGGAAPDLRRRGGHRGPTERAGRQDQEAAPGDHAACPLSARGPKKIGHSART